MERLTKRNKENIAYNDSGIVCSNYCSECSRGTADCKKLKVMINKLAELEDLEEQGLLMRLPCKKGDTVYDLVCCTDGRWRIFKMKVCAVNAFGGMHNLNRQVWNVYLEDDYSKDYVSFYDFGKTVFFTQAEAEEALRKREAEE